MFCVFFSLLYAFHPLCPPFLPAFPWYSWIFTADLGGIKHKEAGRGGKKEPGDGWWLGAKLCTRWLFNFHLFVFFLFKWGLEARATARCSSEYWISFAHFQSLPHSPGINSRKLIILPRAERERLRESGGERERERLRESGRERERWFAQRQWSRSTVHNHTFSALSLIRCYSLLFRFVDE